ncbi:MAG: tetratricopeptide repeat protein, partial [Candidatus Thorarchaeota archaeon]|nr:tetratricopeptide repeat protein [Candidatus Thorarchaeota archaeon]
MSESQDNGYHRRCFDTICKEKWGNEFQTFFEKVMKKTDPSFVPIKTHGGEGDWKCDGYSTNDEILYQVYAPQTSNLASAKRKILKDLEGAKRKWSGRMKKWIFVYGTQSIPAPLQDFIQEQGKRLGVDTELWNEEHIWARVKQLPRDDRIDLLGISGEFYTGHSDKLDELLEIVRGKSIDYEVDPIVFSISQEAQSKKYIDRYIDDTGRINESLESLTCSQILELVLMMFQIRHLQAVIVDEYYRSICEPDQAIDLYKIIYTYQTQDVEEAQKLIKQWPDKQTQAQFLNNLSVFILRDEVRGYKRFNNAIALLNEAISLHPRNSTIARNLGLSYMYSNQFDEAESTFKQFLAHNRNHHSLWRSLGATYAMKIRNLSNRTSEEGLRLFALGSDACRMSLELEPNNFGAWLNLTSLHTLVDRNQEALIYVEKAISIDSSRYEAYTNLGYLFLKMNNLVDAEDALRKALELKPT